MDATPWSPVAAASARCLGNKQPAHFWFTYTTRDRASDRLLIFVRKHDCSVRILRLVVRTVDRLFVEQTRAEDMRGLMDNEADALSFV